MPSLGIKLEVGRSSTSSGAPSGGGGAGFRIDVLDTHANILARTGDAVGVIAYGTDTEDIYVYDGASWQIYQNT